MIPVSLNLVHGQFNFVIIGKGLLELLFESQQACFVETSWLYLGGGTRKIQVAYEPDPDPIKHEEPDRWINALMKYESACSLIEWARQQRARGNWEPAPNKSRKIIELFGKQIIEPATLQAEWIARVNATK